MQKYSSVITIERFLVQNFANYRTMAEISTAKNSLPKSPTELEKDGPSFSSLFSLASACATGDIAPLINKTAMVGCCKLSLYANESCDDHAVYFRR